MKMESLNGLTAKFIEEVLKMENCMGQGRLHSRMVRKFKDSGKMVRISGLIRMTVAGRARLEALNYFDRFEQTDICIIHTISY